MMPAYVVALYLRISEEDKAPAKEAVLRESESISGQRILLRNFITAHPELSGSTVIEVVDDGCSGTSFARPGFQSLLQMLREHTVQCMVVKDFSRFGRSYLEAGNYLEQLFPLLGVRFLSVNDHFDSAHAFGAAGSIDIAFRNLICAAYSRDLSIKIQSVRQANARQGKFVTAFAPYGYRKDKSNPGRLVIDEECAPIVRSIYALFLRGTSKTEIARSLNREGIPSPLMVRRQRGENFYSAPCAETSRWSASSIAQILFDQRYTGDGVYGKTTPLSVGSKQAQTIPREAWIVVPDAHPAIIGRDTFERVGATKVTHTYQRKNEKIPLAKKVICSICHHALIRIRRGGQFCFRCIPHAGQAACKLEIFSEQALESAILFCLHSLILTLPPAAESLPAGKRSPSPLPFTGRRTEQALRQNQAALLTLYGDFKAKRLTPDAFQIRQSKLEAEKSKLTRLLSRREEEYQAAPQPPGSNNIAPLQADAPFSSLTQTLVAALLEMVSVQPGGMVLLRWRFCDPLPGALKK